MKTRVINKYFKRFLSAGLLQALMTPVLLWLPVSDKYNTDLRSASGSSDTSLVLPAVEDMIIIPLKTSGRMFLIEAIIDNQNGNLLFDTGAGELVLNSTYFRKYISKNNIDSHGITGDIAQAERITTWNMIVSGLRYTGKPATITNLSHIENRLGEKLLGLFGLQLLKEFEIVVDYRRNELQLFKVDAKGNRVNKTIKPFISDHSQKIEIAGNIVFINATVGGKPLKFCLDTGAETNALDIHCPKQVLSNVSIKTTTNLAGTGTSKREVLFGIINDFRIGGIELENMSTIVTNLTALNEAYGSEMNGMLGYDFLIRGTICINFKKREFGIKVLKEEE